ncbi:MAG: DHA2 family efflux MFS transporter permease subunit [Bdellovibrionales bacterium]
MIKINMSRPQITSLIVASALFMEHLDSTIIATALPTIARALDASPLHLSLAMTAYMLSLAMFIPLSGWMSDRFGARTVFASAIVVFTVGSLACGLSWDLLSLVLARILQGLGGAMMTPVGRLVLLRSVPRAQLVDAIAWMAAPALIGPLVGPPLGGWIATHLSWRWIFLVNMPIGVLGFILVRKYVANVHEKNAERFDFAGFVMISLAMAGLVFGCETVGRQMIPASATAAMLAGSVALAALYAMHIRKVSAPLIDPRMMNYATYRASVIGGSLFRIATGAMTFLLPVMLQSGFGMTPIDCGWLLIAGAIGAIPTKFFTKPILSRWGFRSVLFANALLCAAFFALYVAFTPRTHIWLMFIVFVAGGAFRSLQFTSLNTVAYADMPERLLSRANTLYTTLQQCMLSLGVALAALMIDATRRANGHINLAAHDFWPSCLALAIIMGTSAIPYVAISPHAGETMSGHRANRARQAAEVSAEE